MSEQIPAGWYPDPQDTVSDPRPERWWDGKGWTATTRPGPLAEPASPLEDTHVLEGQVLGGGPTVRYPELPPFDAVPAPARSRRLSRPVVLAATVAALAGLAVGSGVTYLAMDGRSTTKAAQRVGSKPSHRPGGNNGGLGGGNGGSIGGGPGGGGGGATVDGAAVDVVNRLSLPIPSGWTGGTTATGFAALSVGSYSCPGSGSGECSLGGVNTSRVKGTDPKQAAQQDIAAAAKDSYGAIKSHEELKSEAVTVDGRSGYLVRWKVAAPQGNDGYVETVVFPTADGGSLISVHLGFDIAPKAPNVDQMDTIVKSITDFTGQLTGGASGGTKT